MSASDDRYGDILPGARDDAMRRAIGDLDAVYKHNTSPPPHLGAAMDRALRAHIVEAERALPLACRTPERAWAHRPIAVVAALVAAFVVVGGVYAAVVTLGDQALSQFPVTRPIAADHLGETLNVTRGGCGFAMTLDRAYVDAHRIVIAYTLSGPASRTFLPGLASLDLEGNQRFPSLVDAQGNQFYPGPLEGAGPLAGTAEGQFMMFDATRVISHGTVMPYHVAGETLGLRLIVPNIAMTEQTRGARPVRRACEHYTPGTAPDLRTVAVTGPFSYDITAPIAPTHLVPVSGAIGHAGGVTVTLARLEVTRASTRVYLHMAGIGAPSKLEADLFHLPVDLVIPSGSPHSSPSPHAVSRQGQVDYRGWVAPTTGSFRPIDTTVDLFSDIVGPFDTYHGPATLVVYTRLVKLHDKRTPTSNGYSESFTARYADPVTFHVTFPPVSAAATPPPGGAPTATSTPTTPTMTATALPTVTATGAPTTKTIMPATTMPANTATATATSAATTMPAATSAPTIHS